MRTALANKNTWIDSDQGKLISTEPYYRTVIALKTTNIGKLMRGKEGFVNIIFQRLVTSSREVSLHFDQDSVTLIGKIFIILNGL